MSLRTTLTIATTALLLAGSATAAAAGPDSPATEGTGGVAAVGGLNSPATEGTAVATATEPARVFAVINPNGTRARGRAVASTKHIDTGVYEVRFRRNITTCAWSGTVGFGQTPFNGSTGPVMISVSGRSATNNGVFVQTWNGSGTPTDLPFTVVVVCG